MDSPSASRKTISPTPRAGNAPKRPENALHACLTAFLQKIFKSGIKPKSRSQAAPFFYPTSISSKHQQTKPILCLK